MEWGLACAVYNQFFFSFEKEKKKFSIILSASRLTWRENLASERSMQSRLATHPVGDPTFTSILHIASVYGRDSALLPSPAHLALPPSLLEHSPIFRLQ